MFRQLFKKIDRWLAYNPVGAMSSKGWRLFDKEFREKAPIRWYFHKKFKSDFVYPVTRKISSVYWWIKYRTTNRYHVICTGLPPGYNDIHNVMLHTNFHIFMNFIEIEQAQSCYVFDFEKVQTFWEKYLPYYWKFNTFPAEKYAMKHLNWAAGLDDANIQIHNQSILQAEVARESILLYKWWKYDRPARRTAHHVMVDNQGLGTMSMFDSDFDRTAPDYIQYQLELKVADLNDELWEQEDEAMLIRLIKIRKSLWT